VGKLAGKVALVTGSSSGIGLAIARGLVGEGAAVVLAARRAERLQALAQEIEAAGGQALAAPGDLTLADEVERVFAQTLERFQRLDLLVNNAGTNVLAPIDELSPEDWDQVVNINLRAPFLCTRQAMRIMKRQGGGRIINIGSISAQRVRPNSAPYSASKFGIVGLTHVTALEGRPFGISCGALHPGNTWSELTSDDGVPRHSEPMMQAAELAEAAVLMASMPPQVTVLEAIVMPTEQLYIGRG
jgi:NAD(P)-dependent dehydrogenase (short-subunit alcohol dehydrogenase family)